MLKGSKQELNNTFVLFALVKGVASQKMTLMYPRDQRLTCLLKCKV